MYEMNAKNITDETLVLKAQGGDKQAMDELMLRYSHLVRYLARKFFLVGGETEDLIQEGMMGLFHAVLDYKDKKDGGTSFKNFAYLCTWRKIIDAVKISKSKKNEPLNTSVFEQDVDFAIAVHDPEEEMILDDYRRELKRTMSRVLSDFEFKVFDMYLDGMTSAEICEATGKPPKSIDNAVQRSRKKLQEVLQK